MVHNEPEALIGKTPADQVVNDFLSTLGEPSEISNFAELDIHDFPEKGLFIYFNTTQQLISITFWGMQDEDHKKYKGQLPRKISFDHTKEEIAEKLGVPTRNGWLNGSNVPWELFDFDTVSIHIQYFPEYESIQMITLMSPELARGEF